MSRHHRLELVWGLVCLTAMAGAVFGADTPPAAQGPGEHSTISTSDGSIRDDELADYIASKIPKDGDGNPLVHDVKIFLNSCFGGGVLDDIGRVLDPLGIPWVGGSASSADESAWGPSDAGVGTSDKGSYWTDELVDAIGAGGAGDKVSDDIKSANDNDPKNPTNTTNANEENPQYASGNGGDDIKWNDASKHEVIIFGGKNNAKRHDNNMDNTEDAFDDLFGTSANIQSSEDEGTTTQDLKDMIDTAAGNLDADTQLVLYFDDHGDTEFDFDEWLNWLFPLEPDPIISIDPNPGTGLFDGGLDEPFDLHPGWVQGLSAMEDQPLDSADPFLKVAVDPNSSDLWNTWWEFRLNGDLLNLPLRTQPGDSIEVPVDWTLLETGTNLLSILPIPSSVPFIESPLVLSNLELASGPINEIDDDSPLAPAVIPEPSAILIWTIGLLGAAAFSRRRVRRPSNR